LRIKLAAAAAALLVILSLIGVALATSDDGDSTDDNEVETVDSTTTAPSTETSGTTGQTDPTVAADTTTTEASTSTTTTTVDPVAEVQAILDDPESAAAFANFIDPPPPLAPDCSTWGTQAESQAWFDTNAADYDTSNIDTDGNGQPCTVALAPPTTAPPATTAPDPGPGEGATPAYVPPSSSGACWDCLAQCESGGNWSINSGNGFSGGLQFHHQTWVGFGGLAYAPEAWMASREAQIAVAEKVLASQGRGAWPGCSAGGYW